MQSRILRFAVFAASITVVAGSISWANDQPARYASAIAQYEALSPRERAKWLDWLFVSRAQPACRATMDRTALDRVVKRQRDIVERARAGRELSTDGLLWILKEVDRQENAALTRLSGEYRHATREAVGDNPSEFQRRMQVWDAIKAMCEKSETPFEGQPKLVSWLEAAIVEERMTAAPPLPKAPDFSLVDDTHWRRATGEGYAQLAQPTEVKTAIQFDERELSAAELAQHIERYNQSLEELEKKLYGKRILDVNELNQIVDRLAQLGLARVGLAANVLALAESDRSQLAAVQPLDTAITLARVRISATRRQLLKAADHKTSAGQSNELAGLGRVSQRLDTLATGPDR
jgi:hypothetical protein